MRLLFALLFISNVISARPLVSTTYYVDQTGGSDAANGVTTGTAWKTIAKVNSSSFNPTDLILFKRGEVWNETLIPPSSGTAGSVIYFGAYGTGANPIITGFTTVTGFSQAGSIWSKTIVGGLDSLNAVMVNGSIRAKARYPNSGYLVYTPVSVSAISTDLTGTPDYTGAEAVVRSTHWITNVSTITSQVVGTLNLSPNLSYSSVNFRVNGYFIQNSDDALDVDGEWTYNMATGVLKVYSATTPTVKISNMNYTVQAAKKDYITFENISFEGADYAGIRMDTCYSATIQNCNFTNLGRYGIYYMGCSQMIVRNDSLVNCLTNGVATNIFTTAGKASDSCHIDSNYIKNIGYLNGMAITESYTKNVGIYSFGNDNVITDNYIDSCGYVGINFYGRRTLVKGNYVSNFCYMKDDGGGIYTGIGNYPAGFNDGSIIRSNVVINGIGASDGSVGTSQGACIYLDDLTRLVTVDSNLLYNGFSNTLLIHRADSCPIRYNNVLTTINSNAVGFYGDDPTIAIQDFKHNVIIHANLAAAANLYRTGPSIEFTGIDSNYYSKPYDTTNMFRLYDTDSIPFVMTLSEWQTRSGQDIHSVNVFPIHPTIVAFALPTPIYNLTPTTVVRELNGTFEDVFGNTYEGEITLLPYQNKLLYQKYVDYIEGGRVR